MKLKIRSKENKVMQRLLVLILIGALLNSILSFLSVRVFAYDEGTSLIFFKEYTNNNDYTKYEGETFTVILERSNPGSAAVTVQYTLQNITATGGGVDYQSTSGTATFSH